MGQIVEKTSVQPGKTVPRQFPRAQPKGTPKGQFFQTAQCFSTVSQICNPVGQSCTFKTIKSLKIKPKVAVAVAKGFTESG